VQPASSIKDGDEVVVDDDEDDNDDEDDEDDDVCAIEQEVNGPLLMPFERDAFSFSDLEFPLLDDCVGWSSTINNDFNSKMLFNVMSGRTLDSVTSTFAGKFNGIQTLANNPASIPPFIFFFISNVLFFRS
jgi:hypothetical protein